MLLTKEQKAVVAAILKDIRHKPVTVLAGLAGTGKSTLARHLYDKMPTFAPCAFTGKAANVLRSKGLTDAATIHSLIYTPLADEDGRVAFVRKDKVECDGFLVDEASMVSKELYDDLRSFGKPIVMIGDHGQLEPVGTGINLMANPDYRLEKIHRYAGELAHFAHWVREGKPAAAFPTSGSVQMLNPYRVTPVMMVAVGQVICAYNATRVQKNAAVRQHLGRTQTLHVGERVMCLRNNKSMGLFNGMQGQVARLDGKGRLDLDTGDGVIKGVRYAAEAFGKEKLDLSFVDKDVNPFEYAYCVTAHKCVHPDTLVETDQGLRRIKNIPEEGLVGTPVGARGYINKVRNGTASAIKMTTKYGYSVTVTPDHKVEVWDGKKYTMVDAKDARVGQFVRLRLGATVDAVALAQLPLIGSGDVREVVYNLPTVLDEDVAEFLGLMVGDGTVFKSGFRLAKRHVDVVDRFAELTKKIFGCNPIKIKIGKTEAVEVSSTYLVRWLRTVGGMLPNSKQIPTCVLESPVSVQAAFLRGLFEDGFVHVDRGRRADSIGFSNVNVDLVGDVQVMLLRMGIVSRRIRNRPHMICISGKFCREFRDRVGFVSKFKNDRLLLVDGCEKYVVIPVSKEEVKSVPMRRFDSNNACYRGYMNRARFVRAFAKSGKKDDRLDYFHDRIYELKDTECESYCVEVPGVHRFMQNGFPFGNCQGSEYNTTLVFEQRCKNWDHTRWAYTAATRARNKVYWAAAPTPRPQEDRSNDWF